MPHRSTVDAEPVVDVFFAAIQQGDAATLERLYADDVEVWHNVTGKVMDKDANLALLDFWTASVDLHADVCVVIHVEDDTITRIFEYLDQTAVAAVFARPTQPAAQE